MKQFLKIVLLLAVFNVCAQTSKIECDSNKCYGQYTGPEFVDGSDIAHQFSNQIANRVGEKLKELYKNKDYKKVDFSNITMTTEGMGKGLVIYELEIPFVKVKSKCEAYTSFDHCGGWNHTPALERRKLELKSALLKNKELDISPLLKTQEGLQEYWIQWQNKIVQAECEE